MAQVTVSVAKAVRELGRMAYRMKHPEGALKRVGQYVKGISQQSFRDQADPTTGRPWARLSPATLARRRGRTAQILVDTGRLRRSISSMITGKQTVAVGTSTKYGKYHQFGTGFTSSRSGATNVTIPARPFLGLDKAAETEIRNIVKRYVVEGK